MLQMITSGIALGAIYGLIALGIVMVYKATGILNFAHGEAAMVSAFVAFCLLKLGLPLWAVVPLTLLFGGGLVWGIERFILRRFIGKPLLASAIATLGLFLVMGDLAIWIWGKDPQELPSVFPSKPIDIGAGVVVSGIDIGILVVCAVLAAGLFAFFRFTRLGIAMQATMENPTAARLMGIPIRRIYALSWSLSHLIAALAGLLIAPLTFLHVSMMQHALHFAFAAAVLGGIGSMPGALLGGAVFFGIGAYGVAILTKAGVPLVFAMLIAASVATVVGLLLAVPVLRLEEVLLAIATLGFVMIGTEVAKSGGDFNGGENGMGAAGPAFFGWAMTERTYHLFVAVVLGGALWLARNLGNSRFGRGFLALKGSEIAARSLGLNPTALKLIAFGVCAFYCGLSGALYAPLVRFIDPVKR